MNEVIFEMLPTTIVERICQYSGSVQNRIEEIRIRLERPLELVIDGEPFYPNGYIVTKQDGLTLLNKLSDYSIYTLEEELKRGFITIRGGHRVGLAGKVITEKGQVKAIKDITSYNIRIAKEKVGIADPLTPYLYRGRWLNTIIYGPPQTGKTTLLRDMARMMSTGSYDSNIPSFKVGIVDERSEIAGCVKGIPQHQFGPRIDVLDACPKAEGMMMLIRSMSPDILVVDEIGRMEDTEAILEAVNAGVALFISVHGSSMEDLYKRPSIKPLMELQVFDRFVELSRKYGPGTINTIRKNNDEVIFHKETRVSRS
ncbi:stage III sporulation protein AA [Schinkia azotoformans]|uniref:Stage III sporulation protein AA n=2 Tax=Schinkia azotoformans TaxID=1454 RepID=K6BYQ5_SCHAZ|nr:stage III sporulation protein AA [Schinkia azotoformans]EKN64030.1 stage III sporulation protein AA [Schinkia azotoformans LMG 9581]MEC1640537.1 stage III sporulation protein AA [Schinkia azotoformans]MEC1719448.1 stage III sporulation protein AA [Schinkia azotoformans]MEC1944578.1 stage III sporulation protein AA [Schinkia azotoformans]MED4354725.1 stage III sporulation protein AA [Schinkia azotoformans]